MFDQPTLITCAITGNITKPEQTPYLPVTPEQIANECLASAKASLVEQELPNMLLGQSSRSAYK